MEPILHGRTPIQPFPVEGKGSAPAPPLDGEDTGGVQLAPFSKEVS